MALRCKKKDKGTGLKANVTDYFSTPFLRATSIAATLLFTITISPTAVRAAALEFEIPLSELSKERKAPAPSPAPVVAAKPKKKKAAPKQVAAHTHKAKKQGDKTTPPLSAFVPADRQPATAKPQVSAEPKTTNLPAATAAVTPPVAPSIPAKILAAKTVPMTEPVRIDHDPYSFIIPGKSTVVHAVVYMKETDLKSVSCRIRSVETGELTEIKMEKVNGTRFTYEAILPKMPPNVPSLHYRITTMDIQGKESASTEFMIPVSASPVVPDWQF